MPDFTAFLDKYFKAASIPPGQTIELTVRPFIDKNHAPVRLEEVGQDRESKPVIYFVEDPRGLVLSANKYASLAEANGTRDSDAWGGTRVALKTDPTIKYKGRVVGGVVFDVLSPAPKKE